MSALFTDFVPITDAAKTGASFLVADPEKGDVASAYWATDMWALYCGEDYETTEQVSFEPTHYLPVGLGGRKSQ